MARPRSTDRRWDSKFARFVHSYGVKKLATELGISVDAVYKWVSEQSSPHWSKAVYIQRIARRRGVSLSIHQICRTQAMFQRSPQHARSL